MIDASKLSVRVFADGADMASVRKLAADPLIAGFTTNPTLMRNAGVQDYEAFAHEFLETVSDRPISFEVFSDEFADMERQALKIAPWGDNVYVKIPITNTEGVSLDLVRRLTNAGVQLNITALMTNAQVDATAEALEGVGLRVGVRRAHRRHRPRAGADHGGGPGNAAAAARRRADLGQPARGAEHRPGRPHRLPRDHRDAGPAGQARAVRQGPHRVLARHRAHVPATPAPPATRCDRDRLAPRGRSRRLGPTGTTTPTATAATRRRPSGAGWCWASWARRARAGRRRYLDIGCGQGDLAAEVARRWPVAEVAGLELSAKGAELASGKVPGVGSFSSTC